MKEVSQQEFFNFFMNRTDVSHYTESSKIWVVVIRGTHTVIAKSVEDDDGNEKFFISNR